MPTVSVGGTRSSGSLARPTRSVARGGVWRGLRRLLGVMLGRGGGQSTPSGNAHAKAPRGGTHRM